MEGLRAYAAPRRPLMTWERRVVESEHFHDLSEEWLLGELAQRETEDRHQLVLGTHGQIGCAWRRLEKEN